MTVYTKCLNPKTNREIYKAPNLFEKFINFYEKHETVMTTISAILLFAGMFLFSAAFGNPVSE